MTAFRFDVESGRVLSTLPYPGASPLNFQGRTSAIGWQHAGEYIAYCTPDEGERPPAKLKNRDGGTRRADLIRADTAVCVADSRTGQRIARLHEPGWNIVSFTLPPDGSKIAVCYVTKARDSKLRFETGTGNAVRLVKPYSLPDGRELGTAFEGQPPFGLPMVFSPDGNRLLMSVTVGDRAQPALEELLQISDARTGRLLTATPLQMTPTSLQWSNEGSRLILIGRGEVPGTRVPGARFGILDFPNFEKKSGLPKEVAPMPREKQ
jgi:hypothetical protein